MIYKHRGRLRGHQSIYHLKLSLNSASPIENSRKLWILRFFNFLLKGNQSSIKSIQGSITRFKCFIGLTFFLLIIDYKKGN